MLHHRLLRCALAVSVALNELAALYVVGLEPSPAPAASEDSPPAFAGFQPTLLPKGTQIELPIQPFSDRTTFEAIAYSAPNAWNPFNEYPIAGRILPIVTDTARELLKKMPRIEPTVEGVATLLTWYADCQWTECAGAFHNATGPSLSEIKESGANIALFCNDLVSTF